MAPCMWSTQHNTQSLEVSRRQVLISIPLHFQVQVFITSVSLHIVTYVVSLELKSKRATPIKNFRWLPIAYKIF